MLTPEQLHYIDEDLASNGIVANMPLAHLKNDQPEDTFTEQAAEIDALIEQLGLKSEDWRDAFLCGVVDDNFSEHRITKREIGKFNTRGASIGRYVLDLGFNTLPFESNDDGSATMAIVLALPEDRVITLHGESSLTVDHGSVDGDVDEPTGYYWNIAYKADIATVAP